MVENPTYFALINPVAGLSEKDQRELVAKFQPKEWYIVGRDGDLCQFAKLMRPARFCVVAYAGLLAEHKGSKDSRVESMIATKVAIHKRKSYILEASGRRSDEQWQRMRRDGEEMCRRLAQGRKSALNGRKGAEPYEFLDKHLSRFALIMATGKNDKDRAEQIAAYCKSKKIEMPKRTWLWTKLPTLMRERGLG